MPEKTPLTDPAEKKRAENFASRVEASKKDTQTLIQTWQTNVENRIGKANSRSSVQLDGDSEPQSAINPDWSLTKAKTANLWSQVPTVRGTHVNERYAPAIPPFLKELNAEVGEKRTDMASSMEEVTNDVVNASGIGAHIIGYAARFEDVEIPEEEMLPGPNGMVPSASIPPDQLEQVIAAAAAAGVEIPMRTVQRTTDTKFFCTRISPADLLRPVEFVGSNFENADWIGQRGRCSWSEAKVEFKLKEEQKAQVLATNESQRLHESLRTDQPTADLAMVEQVHYDTLYYRRYRVDPDEKSFSAIWKLVFVDGIEEAVVHEPWKGQQYDPQTRKYIGSCRYPIQVLTLTYISDHAVPPSDSEACRPQVQDLRRSREQMFENRIRSIPVRWFDVNRVDSTVQDQLMRGHFQGWIPTNGDGSRSVGEIARASYPAENIAFDQAEQASIRESWQLGPNQLGSTDSGRRTGTEASITQQNFATRIGQERARVAAFFLRSVEVLAGLMTLYSDFTTLSPEERQQMEQSWDRKHILHELVLNILPDSTIVLDSQQRAKRLSEFLNLTAKSGFVNVKPIIVEMAELYGLDPTKIVVDPKPRVEEPNISFRFSGKDDIINPVVMAILMKYGKGPTPQELEAAKKLLLASAAPPAPQEAMPPQGAPQGAGGQKPHVPMPRGDAHPDWSLMSKVAKRDRDV